MMTEATTIAARVERFVRDTVAPYERDPRCGAHGPSDDLVVELRGLARDAGRTALQALGELGRRRQIVMGHQRVPEGQ